MHASMYPSFCVYMYAAQPRSGRAQALLEAMTALQGGGGMRLVLSNNGPDESVLTWVRAALASDAELIRAGACSPFAGLRCPTALYGCAQSMSMWCRCLAQTRACSFVLVLPDSHIFIACPVAWHEPALYMQARDGAFSTVHAFKLYQIIRRIHKTLLKLGPVMHLFSSKSGLVSYL